MVWIRFSFALTRLNHYIRINGPLFRCWSAVHKDNTVKFTTEKSGTVQEIMQLRNYLAFLRERMRLIFFALHLRTQLACERIQLPILNMANILLFNTDSCLKN